MIVFFHSRFNFINSPSLVHINVSHRVVSTSKLEARNVGVVFDNHLPMPGHINCPRRVLAQTAKTRGGILEVSAYKGGKFCRSRKNLDFSRIGLAKFCRKLRKGLPKLRWGSKNNRRSLGAESLHEILKWRGKSCN